MADLILCAWKRDAIYQAFAEHRPGIMRRSRRSTPNAILIGRIRTSLQRSATLRRGASWRSAGRMPYSGPGRAMAAR